MTLQLAAAVAAGSLVLAGCGDAHGAFVHRSDAICSAYRAAARATAPPRTYAAAATWVERTLPLYEAAVRQLTAVHAPAADASGVAAWHAADERVVAALRALHAAALRRDFPALTTAASNLELASGDSHRAATALGLRVCSIV